MKPWLRQSSASLPPEVHRVAQPIPPTVLQGVRDDTRASDAECAAIAEPLPSSVLDGIRHDTGSSAEELLALSRRLRAVSARRPAALFAPALAFAAALVVAVPTIATLAMLEPPAQPTVGIGIGELALAPGQTYTLNTDIRVEGQGLLRVDHLHDAGADVTVVDGWGRFQVAPDGSARALSVAASDVIVQVKGTIFTVLSQGEQVRVAVERGRVAVTHGGRTVLLDAGASWERPVVVSAAIAAAASVARAPGEPPVADDPGPPSQGGPDPVAAGRPEPGVGVAPARVGRARSEAPALSAVSGVTRSEPAADACALDPFSRACAAERRPTIDAAAEHELFDALRLAMNRVGVDPSADRTTIEACNRFLEQHPTAANADDVRAFRVHAALTGARPSQVVRWADAYLASAAADHGQRSQVERWRALAILRGDALDSAQTGACAEALPLLRELVQLEQGRQRDEAAAWRGICAAATGNRDEARRVLRAVPEHTLPADLRRRVADAWATIR